MKNDLSVVFDFILQQWSFSPQRFKDAIIDAALVKFVLSALWWLTRYLVSKFPDPDAQPTAEGAVAPVPDEPGTATPATPVGAPPAGVAAAPAGGEPAQNPKPDQAAPPSPAPAP